jgi:uncharacterized membrane protein YphA (DoxX/SURF4 family)
MFGLVALLALRVSVGWHFYKEGAKKLNSTETFSSAGFMRQATGPLAESFHNLARQPHDWDKLLAQPREHKPLTAEDQEKIAAWERKIEEERKEKEKRDKEKNKEEIVEEIQPIPPHAAYAAYAQRVAEDWKADLQQLIDRSQAGEEAKKAAAAKYTQYRRFLLVYMQEIEPEVQTYQHELWRLEEMQKSPTANNLPFQQTRIADKKAETARMAGPWVAQVNNLEMGFLSEAGRVLGKEGEVVKLPPPSDQLSTVDRIIPYWHLAVGACLVLGLFSRVAGAAGALFLAMVIATQPPWVAGAADTYYQVVEFCGCLVLATIPTGRFAGLDFFIHSLVSRCCQPK